MSDVSLHQQGALKSSQSQSPLPSLDCVSSGVQLVVSFPTSLCPSSWCTPSPPHSLLLPHIPNTHTHPSPFYIPPASNGRRQSGNKPNRGGRGGGSREERSGTRERESRL